MDEGSYSYANTSDLSPTWHRIPSDRLRSALPGAVVTMAVVLASFVSALALKDVAHLRLDVVIEAVILAAIVCRVQRSADLCDRLTAFVVLPAAAIGASEISRMLSSHPDLGDVLFLGATAGAVWARRFGPRVAQASMLLAAPLVAVLILHGEPTIPPLQTAPIWVGLIAALCCWWVTVIQLISARTGFDRPRRRSPSPRSRTVTAGSSRFRPDASTRMALQMAAALAAAFVVGRNLWPEHWTWVVLTAFIVCSGARGRGDVVLKGVLRAVGAAVGTLVAAGIAGLFGPGNVGAVVGIFVVLGVAMWLRQISYAYWAGCVTAGISLLYSWFGVPADELLRTRLEGIAVGAVIGIAASWLILPVRTSDVVRRRCSEALAALGDLLIADWNDPEELGRHERDFRQSAERVEQVAGPHRAASRLATRWQANSLQGANVVRAISSCVNPAIALESAVRDGGRLVGGPARASRKAVAANVAAVRRAIGRRPGTPYRPAPIPPAAKEDSGAILGALADIDTALGKLADVFCPTTTNQLLDHRT